MARVLHCGTWDTLKTVNTTDAGYAPEGSEAYIYHNFRSRYMVLFRSVEYSDVDDGHPYYLEPTTGPGTWIEQVGDDYTVWKADQIVTGVLESMNWGVAEGSRLNLNLGTIVLGGSGTPKFSVATDGVLTCTGANIAGAITASTIDIGGADESSFHVDADGNMWLGAAIYNIATNPFAVSKAGLMRAVSGTIGGWTLAATYLSGTNALLKSTGVLSLGTGTDAYLQANRIYIDGPNNKLSVGTTFKVENGTLTSTSGTIGGWTLGATSLTSTNIGLHSGTNAEILLGHATTYADAKIGLKNDGSGKLADGNISWTAAGVLTQTITSTGSIKVNQGGDITLLGGTEGNPSVIDLRSDPVSFIYGSSAQLRFSLNDSGCVMVAMWRWSPSHTWYYVDFGPTSGLLSLIEMIDIRIGRLEDNFVNHVEISGDTCVTLTEDTEDRWLRVGHPTYGACEIHQDGESGALPVLYLDQADISEEFIRFIGSAASGVLTQSIVDEGDQASETREGWLKVYVRDDGNQITDQAYYIPIYSLSA